MPEKIRISLIEDHPEYRDTIKMAIDREEDLELVDTFGTAERALQAFQPSTSCHPDVLLLDLALPGADGLTALAAFKEIMPNTRIVILTQSDNEKDVIKAISLGANGYLLKSSTVRQITDGIRAALTGGTPLDPAAAKYIVETLQTKLPSNEPNLLSPREMQVLELLAQGNAQKEIADVLGISPTTVITHVGHIYEKLDAQNAPAAIAKAFGIGILPIKKK